MMDIPVEAVMLFFAGCTGMISVAVANERGREGTQLFLWFCIGFLFSLIGIVAACFIPKMKVCPFCKASVHFDAVLCKHCRSALDVTDNETLKGFE